MKYLYILFLTVCLHLFTSNNFAQGRTTSDIDAIETFIGISPQFYRGFDYKKGEFDVNILPVMIKGRSFSRFGFRFQPHCFLGIRKEKRASVKSFGVELAVPLQLLLYEPEENLLAHRATLGAGTIIMATRTAFNREISVSHAELLPYFSFFLEPAYTIYYDYEIGFTFGVQIGKSLIVEHGHNSYWGNHLAIRVSFLRGAFL